MASASKEMQESGQLLERFQRLNTIEGDGGGSVASRSDSFRNKLRLLKAKQEENEQLLTERDQQVTSLRTLGRRVPMNESFPL